MISKFGTKVKGVLQFVFSRLVVTGLLLLLQAVWLFFLFYKLTEYAQWLTFVGIVISVIMCAALIRQDTTPPEIKISWMVLFMVMPVQGGLLYLLWGDHRPALRLRRKLEEIGLYDVIEPRRGQGYLLVWSCARMWATILSASSSICFS